MKFGTKMHYGDGEFKLIRSHPKIDAKTISGEDFCFRFLCLHVKKKMSNFYILNS